MSDGIETYDRHDPPEVECITVTMRRDENGEAVYTPRCASWLSLLPDEVVAQVCAYAAAACDVMAESFDPNVHRDADAPAPVIRLVTDKPKDDDDD